MSFNFINVIKYLKRYWESSLVSLSAGIYYVGRYVTLNKPFTCS